jgi:hypothetical protein
MKRHTTLLATALAVPALVAAGATAASADRPDAAQGTKVYHSDLDELNDSGATGRAMLRLRGDQLTIRIKARGLLPNSVHAQHIHGEGNSECPPMSAAGSDGVLNVLEGAPFYGPIVSSLTVRGSTAPSAALDVEIMPVADDRGRIDYRRTITLPPEVSNDLDDYQIVQHGVDLNDNGAYDFGPGTSELTSAFPLEATVPANCGTIEHVGHTH